MPGQLSQPARLGELSDLVSDLEEWEDYDTRYRKEIEAGIASLEATVRDAKDDWDQQVEDAEDESEGDDE